MSESNTKPKSNSGSSLNKNERYDFVKGYNNKRLGKRKDIFERYEQVNSFEVDLPNTQNKLVLSVHKSLKDPEDHLFKWSIGKASMFMDAKITFVVAEAMRYLTEDIVPDDLKPKPDIKKPEGAK